MNGPGYPIDKNTAKCPDESAFVSPFFAQNCLTNDMYRGGPVLVQDLRPRVGQSSRGCVSLLSWSKATRTRMSHLGHAASHQAEPEGNGDSGLGAPVAQSRTKMWWWVVELLYVIFRRVTVVAKLQGTATARV